MHFTNLYIIYHNCIKLEEIVILLIVYSLLRHYLACEYIYLHIFIFTHKTNYFPTEIFIVCCMSTVIFSKYIIV